jgi:opacity protein-like surface antigen
MKKLLSAAVLAAFVFSPIAAHATVEPIDWNGDGLSFVVGTSPNQRYLSQQTFYDRANGLLWTNGNVSRGTYDRNTQYDWNQAAGFVSRFNASTNLSDWNNEGLHTWHIPTKEEFGKLVITQGMDSPYMMHRLPFSLGHSYVWTSNSSAPISSQPAHWAFAGQDGRFHAFADTAAMDVWLVTSVPEPETYAMLLAGLGLMGAMTRRRKAQQA